MKEILIKFESEEDYQQFVETICLPTRTLPDGTPDTEWDEENGILIVKDQSK